MASVVGSVGRWSLADGDTRRLHWTQLYRDDQGRPELFVLVYAVNGVLHDRGRTPRQCRRTEPFLRRWQGAMNHWASRNGDVLKDSLSGCEFGRISGLLLTSERIPVTPAPPMPPETSSLVLRTLDPFPASSRPFLSPL